MTNEAGVVEVSYVYRAFGEQLRRLDADGEATTDKAKYSYGGKELDEVTNLYYFNARYYDATIGRFINVDPVQDGTNWYVYCGNNPLAMVDPSGLGEERDYFKPIARFTSSFDKNNCKQLRDAAVYVLYQTARENTSALAIFGEIVSNVDLTNDMIAPAIELTGIYTTLKNLPKSTEVLKQFGSISSKLGFVLSVLGSVVDYGVQEQKAYKADANRFLFDVATKIDDGIVVRATITQEYGRLDYNSLWCADTMKGLSGPRVQPGKTTITAYFDDGSSKTTTIAYCNGYMLPTMAAVTEPDIEEWQPIGWRNANEE